MFERRSVEPLHDRLVAEMRAVYLEDSQPAYMDDIAQDLLAEGREAFLDLGLKTRRFISAEEDTHVLTWRGTALNTLLSILLLSAGLECEPHDLGVTVAGISPAELQTLLLGMTVVPQIDDLSGFVGNLRQAKYDDLAPEALLRRRWEQANAPLMMALEDLVGELTGAEIPPV
jgi:ATP-dependent Lhr-like helicase